ncbi:MAG: hypothetical protein QME71_09520 [Dehalococcoidia bacterium]|nr:hypothetical protein [Dehalococcoidia bacterium]
MPDLADSVAPEENGDGLENDSEPEDGSGGPESSLAGDDLKAAMQGWTEALRSVQKSIDDAAEAIRFLRRTMQDMAPLWQSLTNLEDALRGSVPSQRSVEDARTPTPFPRPVVPTLVEDVDEEEPEVVPEPAEEPPKAAVTPQDVGWESFRRRSEERARPQPRREPEEAPEPVALEPRAALKPVTLVPDDTIAAYSYRMTVEEPGKPVDLVPLHQALNNVAAIRNLSLIGYMNGVASIAIEATEEIAAAEVESAISKTLKQECSVMTHDESTLLVQIGRSARSS